MAVRTTSEAIQKIMEVDTTVITDFDPFITTANELVTECCGDVSNYDDTRLELIERWLAAHFIAISDVRASMEKAGSVSASYDRRIGLGLDQTTYGQQAKLLDTNGGLASLDQKMKRGIGGLTPGITWVGLTDWDTDNAGKDL